MLDILNKIEFIVSYYEGGMEINQNAWNFFCFLLTLLKFVLL